MRLKKILTLLLTLAMVVSLLPATAFAANNTATTMRLAKTQGTVAVTNATGKKVKQTSNMKLYNGYKLKTGAKSYAWISLDNTKVAKLDANSVVSVQKTGQKLTLYLSSGNIFFNVKEKLSGGESFHIKTSTMTTGIRGTSGCVRVINPRVTEIHLLTGQIEVYTENPLMGISKTAILKAGQKAFSLIAEEAMAATGEQAEIIIERLTGREVCGNCSVEIAADPELVERIKEEAPHLLPEEIAAEADERLAADEQAAEEKQAEIDKAVAEQELPEDVNPYFEEEKSSGGGGGGSSNPVVTPSTVVQVSTWAELVQAVNDYNDGTEDVTIEVVAEIDQGTETTTVTVEPTSADNTLTIDLTTAGITMSSTIVNNGNLIVTNTAGHIITEAKTVVENNGTFTLDNGTLQTLDFENGEAVVNNGDFTMDGGAIRGEFDGNHEFASCCGVMNDGIFTMSAGTIDTVGYAIINGQNAEAELMILGGEFAPLSGTQNISGTATVANDEAILDGTFYNNDELLIQGGIWTASYGALVENNSTGTLTMTGGTMHVTEASGYGVNNSGTATLSGGKIYVNNGATDAIGVESSNILVMNGNISVRAYDGTGVRAGDNVTLGDGASILAYDSAKAVVLGGGDDPVNVTRPIQAEVGAERFIDEIDQNVIYPFDEFMDVAVQDGMYRLEDNYGQTVPVTVSTWAQFVAAVDAFNAGTKNMTITLDAAIPAATETGTLETLNTIANNGAALTIDLNNNALTLPQTIANAGDLEITGDGTISADYTAVTTLIQNSGTVELADARMNLSMNQTGIANAAGTVNMTGGQINLNNVPSKGITSEEGTVEMTGGEIILVGSSNSSVNYGIYGNNTKITLDGGTVRESGDTTYSLNCAVYANGGKLDLTSGAVSVNYGQGVYVSSTDIMTLSGTTVTALEYEDLLVTGDNDETGYTYSEYDTTYFKLEKAVPNTVVNTWEQFVAAVTAFNGSSEAQIITLAESIDPTEEEVTAYPMPAGVGNGTSSDLTIDLGTYSLALPATLATSTSSGLVIKGTTGSITTGSQWDGSTYLINNYTDLTLAGGTIDVPHGVVGVNNTGSFDMDGGTMNVVYTTGIQNSGTVNLNVGTITMPAAGAPEGVTEETSIAYSAYMTNGTSAALNLKGTNITMTDGISYVYTDANGDDVDSPAVAVNNEAGNTVTMTAGTITVNSDLGISNKGTLNISGGTITVNADSGENVKGIENFGTFDLESGTMNVNGYGVGVLNGSAGTMNAEGGTINVKAARAVGIENIGATNLEGTTVEARNGYSGGIGVSNTGALTMTAGTIWTDLMPGVSMSAGTFNMTGGSFQSRTTGYGAVDLDGGTATLSGGSITVTGSNAKERGVQVSGDATLIIDGTAITATGYTTYNENNKTIAIYHQSGTVRIDSGTITAESEAFDANTGIGNAYALYSETSNWAGLDVAPGVGVVVRATTAANVINPAHTTYTVSTTAADGYYTLVVPE